MCFLISLKRKLRGCRRAWSSLPTAVADVAAALPPYTDLLKVTTQASDIVSKVPEVSVTELGLGAPSEF